MSELVKKSITSQLYKLQIRLFEDVLCLHLVNHFVNSKQNTIFIRFLIAVTSFRTSLVFSITEYIDVLRLNHIIIPVSLSKCCEMTNSWFELNITCCVYVCVDVAATIMVKIAYFWSFCCELCWRWAGIIQFKCLNHFDITIDDFFFNYVDGE